MLRKIQNFVRRITYSTNLLRIKKNPDSIKWGIIGLGYMAEKFSTAIDANKDGVVHAVASRSLEKAKTFASRHGNCKAYGCYNEMLKDVSATIDVIYIATPVVCHYENIKQCLLAGKNVLCEKPITIGSAQLKELIELAKQNDCFLMEGMWMKCLPTFKKATEWINNGKIGQVELIKVDFYKREVIRPESTIHNTKEGGGVLQDYGVYAISFMNFFLKGLPQKLQYSTRISAQNIDTDWHIYAQNYDVKAFVNISSNFLSQSKAAVIGQKGSIEWNSQFNRTNMINLFDAMGNKIEEFSVQYKNDGFEYQIEEVARCIKMGKKESQAVSLQESLDTLKVIDHLMGNQSRPSGLKS